ncbi:hypothetical protein O0L34_g1072 [Tuta absoluta]|nr:hypothetical protein O0L34_g1072 [Tuta absoluta]
MKSVKFFQRETYRDRNLKQLLFTAPGRDRPKLLKLMRSNQLPSLVWKVSRALITSSGLPVNQGFGLNGGKVDEGLKGTGNLASKPTKVSASTDAKLYSEVKYFRLPQFYHLFWEWAASLPQIIGP